MLYTLLGLPFALNRHRDAPLLDERLAFLKYLQERVTSRAALRNVSGQLLHVIETQANSSFPDFGLLLLQSGVDDSNAGGFGLRKVDSLNLSMIWMLLAPGLSGGIFFLGRHLNQGKGPKIRVDKFLVVQTGILTALAILIALGGTFLPERSSWVKWALSGALFTAIICAALVLFTMINQQAKVLIDQGQHAWIPGITNAGWIALILLAFFCILIKTCASEGSVPIQTGPEQITIVRDRLTLQSTQTEAINKWGPPKIKTDTEFAYQTASGWIVLCFKDANTPVKSITELRGGDENGVKNNCR